MTTSSRTDETRHPDVAEISDFAEGLLSPARGTAVRQHLDACDLCSGVFASLAEIPDLLGALAGPERMPDDVADRVADALAAERDDPGASVSRETSTAADRPTGHPRTATTGPGRTPPRRRRRRRIAVLGTVAAVAALGIGSVVVTSLTGDGSPDETAQGQKTGLTDTFSEGELKGRVTQLITEGQSERSGPRTPHSFGAQSDPGATENGTTENHVFMQPTVPDCVRRGIGRTDDTALATEEGVYQGKEALLVVLPDASDDTRVTAYLVESACVTHPSVGPGKVLLRRSYVRS
ncbi:anti-sigma factor family protein [Streptomyces sp. NPDC048182]|uniref:anti-sigma factor family protein n=1 Tax=Streptomyces sp. NPDC048182 TaxID=3365507 RepID=UPI00371A510C